MLTCSRGNVEKTVSGTLSVKLFGNEIHSEEIKGQRASDSWNTCLCPEHTTYREIHCIVARANQKGERVRGTHQVGRGLAIEYDFTVDTTRTIRNCEYECVSGEPVTDDDRDRWV